MIRPIFLAAAALGTELFFLTLSVGAAFRRDMSARGLGILVTTGISSLLVAEELLVEADRADLIGCFGRHRKVHLFLVLGPLRDVYRRCDVHRQ